MIFIENTVKVPTGRKQWLQWKALFKCELCGNTVEVLKSNGLKQKCCGCHKGIHGMAHTRIYQIWEDMKKRCDNPNTKAYKYYGAKGISYDSRWKDFINFYEDMHSNYEENLTIDRIDPKGNYTKENCQWITLNENSGKDSKGKKQSREWVELRTQNQIKVSKELLNELLLKKNHGITIKQLCIDYNISRDAIKNAIKRYAND